MPRTPKEGRTRADSKTLPVRWTQSELDEIRAASRELGVPVSKLARDGIFEHIARLRGQPDPSVAHCARCGMVPIGHSCPDV